MTTTTDDVYGFECHPGHDITVTPGVFGRAVVECSCGERSVRGSKFAATRAALIHHHAVGGCNCPHAVAAHAVHPGRRS